jgi:hypothetical protein
VTTGSVAGGPKESLTAGLGIAAAAATGSFCNLLSWHIYEWALHGRNFLAMAIKVTQY